MKKLIGVALGLAVSLPTGAQIKAKKEKGSDACAKINAAEAALPSVGGVIDACGFSGVQKCAGTIGPITKMGKLQICAATFQVQSPVIIEASGVTIEGIGWQAQMNGPSLSVIQAGNSFVGASVIQVGGNNANVSGTNIDHLQVDCNSAAGVSGIALNPGTGQAVNGAIDRVYIDHCPGVGLYAAGPGTHNWQVTSSRIEYNGTGVNLETNAWKIAADVINNYGDGYHIDNSTALDISGDVEANGIDNIHITNRDGGVLGLHFAGIYTEPSTTPKTQADINFDCTGAYFIRGVDLSGGYLQGDGITPYAIVFPSTLCVTGADFHGNSFGRYAIGVVNNQGGAQAVFEGNYFGSTAFSSTTGIITSGPN